MGVTFTDTASHSVTLEFNEIIRIKAYTSKVYASYGEAPTVVPMGRNPVKLQLKGYIYSDTDFTAMNAWEGYYITASYGVGETAFDEIAASSIWLVEDLKFQRKGGFGDIWIFDIKVVEVPAVV